MTNFVWKEYPHVGRDVIVMNKDRTVYLGFLSEYDDRTRNIIIQDTKVLERQYKASANWNRPLKLDLAFPVDDIVELISFSKTAKENIEINPMPLFFIFGWFW
jgi:small nuclear ribonucleoprotein (snRNP)-like protein